MNGGADCGTYLYSGKQTDEQSDTILRIPKGNLRRNANASSQCIVDDHCVRITEGSDIDNGTYLYSEKLTLINQMHVTALLSLIRRIIDII